MIRLRAGSRRGSVPAPPSKSDVHRLMTGAALSPEGGILRCGFLSGDTEATLRCLSALGVKVTNEIDAGCPAIRFRSPVSRRPETAPAVLLCGESGTTLRLLLPVAAALGWSVRFQMDGRLPSRPHGPLVDELNRHGARVRTAGNTLECDGQLLPGSYCLPGNVSSQFITGLLFALPLLDGTSTLTVEGILESAPYVAMTEEALRTFGISFEKEDCTYTLPGPQTFRSPEVLQAEADWSGAAAFLCMGAFSASGISCSGLRSDSPQGDRSILSLLRSFGASVSEENGTVTVRRGRLHGITVDASQTPDLVPVIAALAAGAEGETRITGASRLRLKETDRLSAVRIMLTDLGCRAEETDDGLIVRGLAHPAGGKTSSFGDHRIAMAAAVAAQYCSGPVLLDREDCVGKSFPDFWNRFEQLEDEE